MLNWPWQDKRCLLGKGEVEVEKEGGERFFERVVTPLLCSGIQEKRKWELVLHGAVEAVCV